MHEWTDVELSYLSDHFPYEPVTDISYALGLSQPTVSKKARELGLVKSKDYSIRSFQHRYVKDYVHNVTKYKSEYK